VQHNPKLPPGKDAVRAFASSLPDTLRYEPGHDRRRERPRDDPRIVLRHDRKPVVAVGIFRLKDGLIVVIVLVLAAGHPVRIAYFFRPGTPASDPPWWSGLTPFM
jgi:hypothetical protein